MGTWPTVATPTANTTVSIGSFGTPVVSALQIAGPNRWLAKVGRTDGPSVANSDATVANATKLALNTVQYDYDSMATSGGLTINTAGYWHIIGEIEFVSNTTGYRTAVLYDTGGLGAIAHRHDAGLGGLATRVEVNFMGHLGTTRHIELWVGQSSGGSLSVLTNSYSATLAAVWLGA